MVVEVFDLELGFLGMKRNGSVFFFLQLFINEDIDLDIDY